MEITSPTFKENATAALADAQLQKALGNVRGGFIDKRRKAVEALPEFDAAARQCARHQGPHARQSRPLSRGLRGEGHRVRRPCPLGRDGGASARASMLDICRTANARTVTKGKSMITEEIGLNDFLERHDIRPVETDLGEYIIQLRDEHPSHIIAPAVHLNKEQVEADFRRVHTHLPRDARSLRAGSAAQRGAARAALGVFRRPMSASPAPISWSPRPAPRSSSPTRAMATSRRSCRACIS